MLCLQKEAEAEAGDVYLFHCSLYDLVLLSDSGRRFILKFNLWFGLAYYRHVTHENSIFSSFWHNKVPSWNGYDPIWTELNHSRLHYINAVMDFGSVQLWLWQNCAISLCCLVMMNAYSISIIKNSFRNYEWRAKLNQLNKRISTVQFVFLNFIEASQYNRKS